MKEIFTDKEGDFKFEGFLATDDSHLKSFEFQRVMGFVLLDGNVVIIKDGSGWGLPGGGVEEGENAYDALIRELEEEADVVPIKEKVHPLYIMRAFKKENGEWVPKGDQLCCVVLIDVLSDLTDDPDGDIIERKTVSLQELHKFILWPNSIPWIQTWVKKNLPSLMSKG